MGSVKTLETIAGPPVSDLRICPLLSSMITSPGDVLMATPIKLHIVPLGRKTASSFPKSSATLFSSARVVGSDRECSSPTSA